jgi:uncharacterized membrane protein SpoIIM required for sporulation
MRWRVAAPMQWRVAAPGALAHTPRVSTPPSGLSRAARPGERQRLARLQALLARASLGLGQLSEQELVELVQLYRYSTSRIAWHETRHGDAATLEPLRALARRTHALLFEGADRPLEGWVRRAVTYFRDEVPRTIRAEWRILGAAFLLVYGLAFLSYVAVREDLELAYALLDPRAVANEIQQLEETQAGEPFRGNFTFGVGDSPQTAGWIMTHNMSVGVMCFAAGLVPPLYVYIVATNGLMLGTYTAVAAHWGQAGAISSILWCHGTLEIQAIVLAGAAGLVLLRAWIAPGPWSRRHAMALESQRALRMLAAVFPMLFCAGLIEGFVSPHAPVEIRLLVAALTGLALIAWIGLGGRGSIAR